MPPRKRARTTSRHGDPLVNEWIDMDDSKADLTLVVQDGDEEWLLPVRRAVLELTSELVAGLPDEEGDAEMPVIGHGAASVVRFLRLCYPNMHQPIDSELVFKVAPVASWFQASRIMDTFVEHVETKLSGNESKAVAAAVQLQSIGKEIKLSDYAIQTLIRMLDGEFNGNGKSDGDGNFEIAGIVRVPVLTQCIECCQRHVESSIRNYRCNDPYDPHYVSRLVRLAKHLLQFHPRQ